MKRSPESFDGRAVRDVTLINKYTNRTMMLVRIDEQTKLVLDKQQFASDGAMVSQMRFEEVSYSSTFRVPISIFQRLYGRSRSAFRRSVPRRP